MGREGRHLIVARVDNKPGVLSRISGLFTRRGYNIESLVTGRTSRGDIYHITASVIGSDSEVLLLARQLERLMEVIDVKTDLDGDGPFLVRELMLIRVRCSLEQRAELMRICEQTDCRLARADRETAVIEVEGDETKLENCITAVEHLGIVELVRSGLMSI